MMNMVNDDNIWSFWCWGRWKIIQHNHIISHASDKIWNIINFTMCDGRSTITITIPKIMVTWLILPWGMERLTRLLDNNNNNNKRYKWNSKINNNNKNKDEIMNSTLGDGDTEYVAVIRSGNSSVIWQWLWWKINMTMNMMKYLYVHQDNNRPDCHHNYHL